MGIWIFFAVMAVPVVWAIITYNTLIALRNQVKNGWRQIDVQLKRRHDLIPNLVQVAKDYMTYEQETLHKVIEARNAAVGAKTPVEALPVEAALSAELGKLFALMENYPDLKANENVARLMEELSGTENKIAFSRQFYNDSVMGMNNAVQSFPNNIIAGLFSFRQEAYFEVPLSEKSAPAVSLR